MNPTTILLPLDLSDLSLEAIPEAIELAGRFDAVLELLHVVEEDPLLQAYGPVEGFTTDFEGQFEKANRFATTKLTELAESIEADHGLSTRVIVVRGRATSEIVRVAGIAGDKLIVLNTHGRSGFETALIGSVTERIVRFSPCPVWVSRGTALEGVRTVLCAVDFAETSLEIISQALAVAETWGASIRFVYVFEDSWVSSVARTVLFPLKNPDHIDGHSMDEVRALLEAEVAKRVPSLTKDQILIRQGHTVKTICEMSEHEDLVVLGTHRRVGLDRVIHGSVAERVIRAAKCSALIVGRPA